jgi:hypothetical protein
MNWMITQVGSIVINFLRDVFILQLQRVFCSSAVSCLYCMGPTMHIRPMVSDVRNPACNAIGIHAAVEINGCDAGMTILDHYANRLTSIAHEMSGHLQRGVYAYDVGLYFSHLDADHDPFFDGRDPVTGNSRTVTATLPVYMVPEGAPGIKPKALPR